MRVTSRLLIPALGIAFTALGVAAKSVSAIAGNIYLTDDGGTARQLTFSGRDSGPVLSPDGLWIVFIHALSGQRILTNSGDELEPTQLWQIGANGKNATRLLRCRLSEKMEEVIAEFADPQFSSDGRYVYFTTHAWTTSPAVHVVDTTNAKEHFVCPGGSLEVLRSGQYRDCLLVRQHRYFLGGGSYDWFWLLRPDGNEIGPVGEDPSNFKELYLKR
jgi:WD40-like Beta Propeller Repeat